VIEKDGPPAEILVIDDSSANLRLLEQTLGERGYVVRTVASGARGLESATASPPNLILLDIRMPTMDGFEVCRRLKENEQTRSIPVIFISALDDLEDKVHAFRAGGVDYVTKPFQVEEVLARTETHLELRRLQDRLEQTNQRLERELSLAARVQASFLPHRMPELEGWDLAAVLHPARETSGDFYDIIRLPDEKYGLLIADVVDKGMPAALLMALSWSLIWTYATEHTRSPSAVFDAVNHSLNLHLEGQQFLTAFFAVLDPLTRRFSYVNAGHPPVLRLGAAGEIHRLTRTGPPLGLDPGAVWPAVENELAQGETLVLYTDGVIDAEAESREFYGEDRLLGAVRRSVGASALGICDAVMADIQSLVGGAPQVDDIALMVVRCRPARPGSLGV
jgi:sigma-B regulation protein RsbU (phosphoserine phosphatase)